MTLTFLDFFAGVGGFRRGLELVSVLYGIDRVEKI